MNIFRLLLFNPIFLNTIDKAVHIRYIIGGTINGKI